MRILHVSKLYYPWIGGVEYVAQLIAEGVGGEVLVCQSKGERVQEVLNGITVFRAASLGIMLGMPISLDFFTLFKKRTRSADLILLHHPFPLGSLALYLFGRKKRFVVYYHSDIVRQKITGALVRPFVNWTFARAERIFVASENLKRHSPHLVPFVSKVDVVPFGIDTHYFAPSEDFFKEAEVIRSGHQSLLLSVGRLTYYKGYIYLISAMKKIEDAHLIIIGEGKEKAALSRAIAEAGIEDRVTILPHVADVRPYYTAADVFIFPSSEPSEAFGLVQAEAMAFELPVINTALPTGVPEVSLNESTGITVPPKDSVSLCKAIHTLLSDDTLRHKYGKHARERVLSLYSKDMFTKTMYEKLQHIVRKNNL